MKKQFILANAVLWAAAIIASAALDAPTFLSLILLPSLAALSVLTMDQGACFQRSRPS